GWRPGACPAPSPDGSDLPGRRASAARGASRPRARSGDDRRPATALETDLRPGAARGGTALPGLVARARLGRPWPLPSPWNLHVRLLVRARREGARTGPRRLRGLAIRRADHVRVLQR